MEFAHLIPPAGQAIADVCLGVKPEHLDAATPCPDWTVRQLVSHLRYWSPVLERAGRKQPVPTEPLPDADADLAVDDWHERYAGQLTTLIDAWRDPAAWTGTTRMTGPEGPAPMYGGMVLCELVLHGWDLARATGQELVCSDEIAAAALQVVTPMAEQGRTMGAFGTPVDIDEPAPPLWRVLAVSGRDPQWTPLRG